MLQPRFDALAMWNRSPGSRALLINKSFWATSDEDAIGATYYLEEIDRFAYILLARDASGRYRPVENMGPFTSGRAADVKISERLRELESGSIPIAQLDDALRAGVNLFAPIAGAKLNPKFLNLRDGHNGSAARELLDEISRWVVDLDGNFARDFQTTGFDARIWELYLFAAFTELDFGFDRSSAVPDFHLSREDANVFVEAVTANPTGIVPVDITGPPPLPPEDFWHYIEHEMPQKFGSPLASKLRKRYWEREEVKGHPFVLAIADFHSPASMVWSHTALLAYLYGVGVEVRHTSAGQKYGVKKPLSEHVVGKKVIPSHFFGQDEARHISAVLFSNAGTLTKFNRMGVLAGFGDPEVTLTRQGGFNDPHPSAFDPILFKTNIEHPDYIEHWADEIEIYHNPNALVPLPEETFSGVTQFFVEDGEQVWRGPSPRVLFSFTTSVHHRADSADTERS